MLASVQGPDRLCRASGAGAELERCQERSDRREPHVPYRAPQGVPESHTGLPRTATGTLTVRHYRRSVESQVCYGGPEKGVESAAETRPVKSGEEEVGAWEAPHFPRCTSCRAYPHPLSLQRFHERLLSLLQPAETGGVTKRMHHREIKADHCGGKQSFLKLRGFSFRDKQLKIRGRRPPNYGNGEMPSFPHKSCLSGKVCVQHCPLLATARSAAEWQWLLPS